MQGIRRAAAAAAAALLAACNGIFEDIYDTPVAETQYGFIAVDEAQHRGTIYLDATSYTEWHYIDLHNKRVVTAPVAEDAAAAEPWDFAIHRYDTKTCGGRVADSGCTTFAEAIAAGAALSEADYTADERTADRIATDMSQMMEGIIRYAEDDYNPVLSRWLDVDTSTMPPIYTLSGRVYLLRLADGTQAALKLVDFLNSAAVKGFMTVEYYYPL